MDQMKLDSALDAAMKDASKRLYGVVRLVHPQNAYDVTMSIMKEVMDKIDGDKRYHGVYGYDRKNPVPHGIAKSFYPFLYHDAKIRLIDSWTRPGQIRDIGKIVIQGKSFRPYLPSMGIKSDHGYEKYLKKMISQRPEDVDLVVREILKTRLKSDGMYDVNESFQCYAPKICLLYANLDQKDNRYVFMMRPGGGELSPFAYKAYCFVCADALRRRDQDISVDLMFWERLDLEQREVFKRSAVVRDAQLCTHGRDEVKGTWGEIQETIPNIETPVLIAA